MSEATEATNKQRRGIRLTVLVILLIAGSLVAGFFYAFTKARVMTKDELRDQGAYLYENPRMIPGFSLLDEQGKTLTPEALKGQWNLIFFGFTYCPDICPTTLAQLKLLYQELEPDVQANTQIWLASVDPARDTPEQMRSYLAFFHPLFRGITQGNPMALASEPPIKALIKLFLNPAPHHVVLLPVFGVASGISLAIAHLSFWSLDFWSLMSPLALPLVLFAFLSLGLVASGLLVLWLSEGTPQLGLVPVAAVGLVLFDFCFEQPGFPVTAERFMDYLQSGWGQTPIWLGFWVACFLLFFY